MTKPKSWNGNFYSVSLYESFEYFLSDFKNIKESLCCITSYIKNKKIDCNKANDLTNFNDIGKVA